MKFDHNRTSEVTLSFQENYDLDHKANMWTAFNILNYYF